MQKDIPLSSLVNFDSVDWHQVPAEPGVYVIYEGDEVLYVGMSGRSGKGNLSNRLKDHGSGQIVNMFAQYLYLARVQFVQDGPITHPRDAKAACRKYVRERCSFRYAVTRTGSEARALESELKRSLEPALNP